MLNHPSNMNDMNHHHNVHITCLFMIITYLSSQALPNVAFFHHRRNRTIMGKWWGHVRISHWVILGYPIFIQTPASSGEIERDWNSALSWADELNQNDAFWHEGFLENSVIFPGFLGWDRHPNSRVPLFCVSILQVHWIDLREHVPETMFFF